MHFNQRHLLLSHAPHLLSYAPPKLCTEIKGKLTWHRGHQGERLTGTALFHLPITSVHLHV